MTPPDPDPIRAMRAVPTSWDARQVVPCLRGKPPLIHHPPSLHVVTRHKDALIHPPLPAMSAPHSRASLTGATAAHSRPSSPAPHPSTLAQASTSPSKLGLGAAPSALRTPLDPRLAYTVWPGAAQHDAHSTGAASSSSPPKPPPIIHLRLSHDLFDDLVARYSEPGLSVALRVEGEAASLHIGNVSHPLAHSQEPTLHEVYQVSPSDGSSGSGSSTGTGTSADASPWLRRLGHVKDRYSVLADARSASAAATRLRERREEEEARKKGNRTVLLDSTAADAKAKAKRPVSIGTKNANLPRRAGNSVSPTKAGGSASASPMPSSIGREHRDKERTALGGTRVDLRTARDPETAPMPARLIHLLAPGPMARRSIVASLRQPEPSVVALLNQFAHSPASVQPPPDDEAKAATKKYKGPVNRRLSAQAARNSAAGSAKAADVSPPRAGPGTVYVLRDESYRLVRFEWASWDKATRRGVSERAEEAYDRLALPRDAPERKDLHPDGRPTREDKEMEKRKARSREEEAKLDDGGELSEDVDDSTKSSRMAKATEGSSLKGLGLLDEDDNMSGFESSTSAAAAPLASSVSGAPGAAKMKKTTSSAHDRLKKAAIGRGPTPAERAKQAEKLRIKQLKAESAGPSNGSSASASASNGSSSASSSISASATSGTGSAPTSAKKAPPSAMAASTREKDKGRDDEAILAALGGPKRGVAVDAVPWVPEQDKETTPPSARSSSRRKAAEDNAPAPVAPAEATMNKRGTKRRSSVALDKEQPPVAAKAASKRDKPTWAPANAGKRPSSASSTGAGRSAPVLARHLDYTDSEEEGEDDDGEPESKRRKGSGSTGGSISPDKTMRGGVAAGKSTTSSSSTRPSPSQTKPSSAVTLSTSADKGPPPSRQGVGTGASSSSEPWLSIRNDGDWMTLAERFGRVYDEYAKLRERIEREGVMLRRELGRAGGREGEGEGGDGREEGRVGRDRRESGGSRVGKGKDQGEGTGGETLRWRVKSEAKANGEGKSKDGVGSRGRVQANVGGDADEGEGEGEGEGQGEGEVEGPMAYEELERTVRRTEEIRCQLERMKARLVEYKDSRARARGRGGGDGAARRR